jgi:hypothetical protein
MTHDRKHGGRAEGDEAEAARGGVTGLLPDVVRRAVLTGMGALFMTEEGIRNVVGELKLPKDALNFLLQQAEKTRSEVTRVVTQEVRRFLESETLRREIFKVLSSVTVEVNAQIKLKPTGEPSVSTKVRARREGKESEPEPDGGDPPADGRA